MDRLASGPWLEVVLDDVEPSKWLLQGDLLLDVRIPVFKTPLDLQNDPTPEIPVEEGKFIVVTQSCDLAARFTVFDAHVASLRTAVHARGIARRYSAVQEVTRRDRVRAEIDALLSRPVPHDDNTSVERRLPKLIQHPRQDLVCFAPAGTRAD